MGAREESRSLESEYTPTILTNQAVREDEARHTAVGTPFGLPAGGALLSCNRLPAEVVSV